MWNKSKETTWTCVSCLDVSIPLSGGQGLCPKSRRSIGPGAAPPLGNPGDDVPGAPGGSSQVSLSDIMEKLLQIESQYTDLLQKYEDQIKINAELRSELSEVRQQMSAGKGSHSPQATDRNLDNGILSEVFQRQSRMNNLMIFNMRLEEGTPELAQISSMLSVAASRQIEPSNMVKVGQPNRNGHKPIKVVLSNNSDVSAVLKNRKKIIENHQIYIEADLSPAQLKQLRDTKEELQNRRAGGEDNLVLRYVNGVPTISTKNLGLPPPQQAS